MTPNGNRLLALPVEIQLHIMTHLNSIYTLKHLLDAFPDELYPIFQPYAKSILNTIFWRPSQRFAKLDERGVVYRWMLREIQLGHLLDDDGAEKHSERITTMTIPATAVAMPPLSKYQDRSRPVLCDDNDID